MDFQTYKISMICIGALLLIVLVVGISSTKQVRQTLAKGVAKIKSVVKKKPLKSKVWKPTYISPDFARPKYDLQTMFT